MESTTLFNPSAPLTLPELDAIYAALREYAKVVEFPSDKFDAVTDAQAKIGRLRRKARANA